MTEKPKLQAGFESEEIRYWLKLHLEKHRIKLNDVRKGKQGFHLQFEGLTKYFIFGEFLNHCIWAIQDCFDDQWWNVEAIWINGKGEGYSITVNLHLCLYDKVKVKPVNKEWLEHKKWLEAEKRRSRKEMGKYDNQREPQD